MISDFSENLYRTFYDGPVSPLNPLYGSLLWSLFFSRGT